MTVWFTLLLIEPKKLSIFAEIFNKQSLAYRNNLLVFHQTVQRIDSSRDAATHKKTIRKNELIFSPEWE